jgi:hypothetical protein
VWHAYGNTNGYAHIHSDSDCDGNRHIHSNSDCDGNGHNHADSDSNSDIYSNSYGYGYRDSDSYRHSNSNGKRIAATFTDGTASSDAGTATVKLCGLFISLGTRERTSRVLGYGRRASVKDAISFTKSPPIR